MPIVEAKSLSFSTEQELVVKLRKLESTGYQATLAILFASTETDYLAASEVLDGRSIKIFGATSAGEIVDDDVRKKSMAVMLLDLSEDYFEILTIDTKEQDTREASQSIATKALAVFENPAILLMSSGLDRDGEEIVRGLSDQLPETTAIAGGLAGDDFRLECTSVFSNTWKSDHGLICLVIDSDFIDVQGVTTCGWVPIGVEKTVTKSEGNVVYTLDHEPVLDVFTKYLGVEEDLKSDRDIFAKLGVNHPLVVLRDDGKHVVRAALLCDFETKSLTFAGTVEEGAKVRFTIPPSLDIVETVENEARELLEDIPKADAMILFSCIARHTALGPIMEDEVSNVRKIWDTPLVGLLTYGEIGKMRHSPCDFHNESYSLAVLKEK